MPTFRHVLLEEVQGDHLKNDIISFMYESTIHRKWKSLRHAIIKKLESNTFEEYIAENAIREFVSKLQCEYSDTNCIVVEKETTRIIEAEFMDKINLLTEAADDYRFITAARGVFPRPMISVVRYKSDPVLTIKITSKALLRRYLPKTYRVLEKRGYDDLNAVVWVNTAVGIQLNRIDENGKSSLVAETDMDGNFSSNALANRLVATLKQERSINKVIAKLRGNDEI